MAHSSRRLTALALLFACLGLTSCGKALGSQMLKPGDHAPDFKRLSQTGDSIQLSDFRKRKNVVLFFYPKDFTSGCTKEVCRFRDSYETFAKLGAEVIGVSEDDQVSHQKFAAANKLPFVLLPDSDGSLHQQYGVTKTLGVLPARVTFLIDQQGVIRHVFSSLLNPERHIEEALKSLQLLNHQPVPRP